ncbi:hypothetical protein EJ02DRAFT_44728 [Clathrospora elynae]|uniref:Uncharacterized protein n=1 Tax=Clathrospora elynae TaxID=706981 RepID=A0A6A5SZN4_9PLEO|nr:hypothetical protein EJ02DRAFT_44728 [Clathrospora elynae]
MDHHRNQHAPPSPPPSPPPSTRRRLKKRSDPFEQLAQTPIPARPSSLANELEDDQESLLTRIIFTPVLFVSFILSLFLVNYRNRARRAEAHSSQYTILKYLAPSAWLDPEPYQNPHDSTWGHRGSARHVEPHDAIGPRDDGQSKSGKKKSWHLNKKIRKIAKMEVGDAFEMRGQIIVAMVAMLLVSSVVLWMGMKWLFVSLSNTLLGARS